MSTLPAAAPQDDPELRTALGRWLEARLAAGRVSVTGLGRPRSGYSAETVVVDADVSGAARRFVLR